MDEADTATDTKQEDVVLIRGRTDDGGLQILRKKGDEFSSGELRPLEDGKPIVGNVLQLTPRKDTPLLCDVTHEVKLTPTVKGPAKVASPRYRQGWDELWGKRDPKRKPN